MVRVEGDARRRGERIGAELADPIHRSLSFYRQFLSRRGTDPDDLPSILGPYRDAAASAFPDLVEEMDGMARGAGASTWELFAVNAFEELEPVLPSVTAPLERCTAFVVDGEEGPILAHNEQWYAGDEGNVAVIVAKPEEGIHLASPTVATWIPAVGLNAAGGAQAIMSLVAVDDGVGIPRVPVSRHSLQAADAKDAVSRATTPGRAGGYAHLFAFPEGRPFVVETTATRHAVLPGQGVHTNHYLDAGLAALAPEPSPGSVARLERARSLLASDEPTTPEQAMRILGDHGGAQSICVHAKKGAPESDAIVFSMVCDVGRGRMWVAPGQPCRTPFEEIDLQGVLP